MTDIIMHFAVQATRIIIPISITLGIVSNSLNIFILTRPTLIHHACSLYFLCLAITNLFYSVFILIINLLADGYQLDLSLYSNGFCKFISYLLNLCPNISVYLIVLASIDRCCASSSNVGIRNFSSVRVARWAIGLLILIFAFFFSGALVAFDLRQDGPLGCTLQSNLLFSQIFLIIDIILYVIIAPFCMVFFGVLTIKHTNQLRINLHRISLYRRTERQLSRMLFFQVGTHIILALPFCITFFMLVLPISLRFTLDFDYIYILSKLPFYLTFTTAFFLYILSGQVYRNELIRLFKKLFPVRRVTPIHVITNSNLPLPMNTRFLNR